VQNLNFQRMRAGAFSYLFRLASILLFAAVLVPVISADTQRVTVGRLRVELQRVVDRTLFVSQDFPLFVDTDGSGSGRLYLPHQRGEVRSVLNNVYNMYLDLSSEAYSNGPRGLLGTQFHPGYADPLSPGYRKFYTFHSVRVPETPVPVDFQSAGTVTNHNLITEWKACDQGENPSCTPGTIDVSTRREIIRQAHVDNTGQGLHGGGMLEFGPDGYLYAHIGTPPQGTPNLMLAQDLASIQGKIFRIDPLDPALTPGSDDTVSANGKYRIPDDNPFADEALYPTALDEVWARGMRNMYRFSIDPVSGLLFGGDVGNASREEISVVPEGGNMGWPHLEGTVAGPIAGGTGPFVEPLGDYRHADGRAVVGGYVYRGSIPALQGKYIFGEFSWGAGSYNDNEGRLLWADPFDEMGQLKSPSEISIQELVKGETCAQSYSNICALDMTLYSFGIDDDGELYAVGFEKFTAPAKMVVYKFTDAYFIPEGDFDEDGIVDADDNSVWRSNYGAVPGITPQRRGYGADGNRDGVIDGADYVMWRKLLGSGGSGGLANVPEPAVSLVAITAFAAFGVTTGRTRRKGVAA
jgi:hypothetical protein